MGATDDFGDPPGIRRVGALHEDAGGRPAVRLASGADEAAGQLARLLAGPLPGSAPSVATALVATFGSLAAVLAARRWQLAGVPGMTDSAVRLVQATHAVHRSAAREQIRERDLLDDPTAVEVYVRVTLRCRPAEEAHGLFLDARNFLIRDLLLSRGIVNHTPLYPREVVRTALLLDASALILVHNHPSGDPTPSVADVQVTRRIADALAAVNVALHDHLVVGDNRIASMRALGML